MSKLQFLRRLGLRVAAHNDYRQDGQWFTFYLMTYQPSDRLPMWAFKGEAATDEDALEQIHQQYLDVCRRHQLPPFGLVRISCPRPETHDQECGHDCPTYCLGAVVAQIEDLDEPDRLAVLAEALHQHKEVKETR